MSKPSAANTRRIHRARTAIRLYAGALGDEWAHDRETIADLLTDLMHMCAASRGKGKVDFDECLESAKGHFAAERPTRAAKDTKREFARVGIAMSNGTADELSKIINH